MTLNSQKYISDEQNLNRKSKTSNILEDQVRDYDLGTDFFSSGKVQKCQCERKILVNITTAT